MHAVGIPGKIFSEIIGIQCDGAACRPCPGKSAKRISEVLVKLAIMANLTGTFVYAVLPVPQMFIPGELYENRKLDGCDTYGTYL